jgi:hypothetical protein
MTDEVTHTLDYYDKDRNKNYEDWEKTSASLDLNGFWKYSEGKILKEIQEYLSGTYRAHYTSQESKTQTLDLIEGIGDAEPFCRSNAIKYLSRFGKKNGKSKLDILKAIHYCILLYHFSGLTKDGNANGYETF